MTHDSAQIPLDAGMWLDDVNPPASANDLAVSASTPASLEDSLELLHSGTAHTTLTFDDADADVHSLFPMLSEASFDYEDDSKALQQNKPDAPFPGELSPILTAMPMPKALQSVATPTGQLPPTTVLQPRRKSSTTTTPASTKATAETRVGVPIPFPQDMSTPTATRKRRRRLRSTSLMAALTQWSEHEQNVFFVVFKPKWSIAAPTPEQFAVLLLERFDTVSEKLKSTNKTSHDVEAFYNTMLQSITDLLDVAAPHDIDLLNPDEIRIALRCWHKMLTESEKRSDLEHIDEASEEIKRPLAQALLQSIVRSRRQMLKAKTASHTAAVDESQLLLPPTLDESEELESLEGLLREALEHSSLPSYLYQLAPVEANAAPVVHHPVVRRKSSNKQLQAAPASPNLKRQRSESAELHQAFTNGTPLKSVSAGAATNGASSYVTPSSTNPAKKIKQEPLNQTPHQSSRKKIYIKLRMVPRDTQTKDIVERSGCNPKVELKLNSTKKVSDVLAHMTKKWAKVGALVDTHATLHFYQKDSSVPSPELAASANKMANELPSVQSWSRRNHDVTCFDIWKQSGKMKNDEYIAVVSYQWCVDEDVNTSLTAWVEDSTPLLDFLDGEMAHTKKQLLFDQDNCSSKENSPFASPMNLEDPSHMPITPERAAAQVQPLETKQSSFLAFSETVAFDTKLYAETEGTDEQISLASLPDDALNELMEYSPNTQRMRRRRITPVLVPTDECQI